MDIFTTKDRDKDSYDEVNCANSYKVGLWYGFCQWSEIKETYGNFIS